MLSLSIAIWLVVSYSLFAQSIPEERRITYREQLLTPYDPFTDGKLIEAPTCYRGQWGITQDDYIRSR